MELPSLGSLLEAHGLADVPEKPLEHDGWSGAALTRLVRGDGARFVLKRDSLARDWIARVTEDEPILREGRLVAAAPRLPSPVRLPHLAVARDGEDVALLMPDLTGALLPWERPVSVEDLERVLGALAALHGEPWHRQVPKGFPWTSLERRVLLLTRAAAERYRAEGNPVGQRFLDGWAAFDRSAPRPARELVATLSAPGGPLIAALAPLPVAGLHGDLKLGNVALHPDGTVDLIDWQMTLVAPIAVELGWFLVSNVAGIPLPPDEVLEGYRRAAGLEADDAWRAQRDLAILVGLVLRGWRKGLDAEAGVELATGSGARDDLAWWCAEALGAAQRRLQ